MVRCPSSWAMSQFSRNQLPVAGTAMTARGRPAATSSRTDMADAADANGVNRATDAAIPAVETRRYSGHSLRRGGATSMLAAGALGAHRCASWRACDSARRATTLNTSRRIAALLARMRNQQTAEDRRELGAVARK